MSCIKTTYKHILGLFKYFLLVRDCYLNSVSE